MAEFFLRVSRVRVVVVALIVLAAIFLDGYSLFYRYFVVHQPLGQNLTTIPNIGGHPITFVKGLDLQGGTELTVQVCRGYNDPPGGNCRNGPRGQSVGEARDKTLPLLQARVNGLGVSEAAVSAQGPDQILIQLPGVSLDQARKTVGTTAKLHFATAVPGAPNPNDPQFLADQEHLFNTQQFAVTQYYQAGYHWKIDDALDASDVTKADVGVDQSGQIAVNINFNEAGATEWGKVTQTAFAAGANSPLNRVAIFLDSDVITAPGVTGPSTNQTQITGSFTNPQAQALASAISAGALPAEITTVSSNEVSATLGQQTVQRSLIAGAVGLLIIVFFMIGYYRFPGLLACVALVAYGVMVLALFKVIGVTISLAALAGFVLSVGMAVDANVLIFERARDELRHGRSVAAAVDAGFKRAFPAIRDSNVSTIIACVVLFSFGSSVVKGFALTLGLGVAISFVSAVTVTRALMAGALRLRLGRTPTMYTQIHEEYVEKPPKGRFDIVRSRNWYFAGSLAIIIPGILAILFWGFRLGLDFRGGYKVTATLVQHTTQAQVASTVTSAIGNLQPQVQASTGNQYEISFLPGNANGGKDPVQAVQTALNNSFGIAKDAKNGNPNIQEQFIGPSVAADLVRNAILLILVASALIAIYLALAFRRQKAISPWRFSVCAFLKLLHDVFVLAGIWAILGHFTSLGEVDTLFVTAILTSVAFSIHDTIVVFDRVRENLRYGPRLTFDQVVNLSTVQTMTRSLNTSLTVVFVLLALVLFGGSTITGFVLALLIGIITGTYSSIFNASTLLVAWQKASALRSSAPPPGTPKRVARAA
ncbi:MAG: protein translocase subunit SecD [Candidatus Dormibacteraeota bacterium]|uniref:Multifunctional fusion protein n=1 Tax=Candidatus Amunia macphersoniae TaxID=3127014 RepID=A0A934KF63_9BACT|nr:protein translocase subunit SecD [Candidatus Dormibacteraeota bacterium]